MNASNAVPGQCHVRIVHRVHMCQGKAQAVTCHFHMFHGHMHPLFLLGIINDVVVEADSSSCVELIPIAN